MRNRKMPRAMKDERLSPPQTERQGAAVVGGSIEYASLAFAVEADPTGVAVFDSLGRLSYSNVAFRELYKLDGPQLMTPVTTQRLVEFLRPRFEEEMDALRCLVPSRFVGNLGSPETLRVSLSDGSTVQVSHSLSPDGGWVSRHSQLDLGGHTEVNQELFSLQALIDQLPDYLWVKDTESRFVVANLALAMDCGMTASTDLIGLTDFEFHSPDKAMNFYAREQEVLRSGIPMIDEEEAIIDASGQRKWLSSSKLPLRNDEGKVVGLIGVARDITARLRAEELRQHAFDLEETSRQLTLALEQERKLNALQRQFVSMASHEFRTPLAIIDGAAQRLIRHKGTPSLEFVSEKSQLIRQAVGRIVELMESILSSNKLDDGKASLTIEEFSLRDVLHQCCRRQQEIATRHQILCDLGDLPSRFTGDRSAIEQVFTNLLSNAVKYSPQSRDILVSATVEEKQALISVRDFGLGIDAEDLPKMFERYFRARTSTGIAGTGIGLNLVKKMVELHDGNIRVDSIPGEGSVFTVSLPLGGFLGGKGQVK
jgi:PAS domain S-box-containing protein